MAQERSQGLAVSRAYFEALIEPALAAAFPDLRYSAARIGAGSDVLGLDDETSRDHDWGLRVALTVPPGSVEDVRRMLESRLPTAFEGLPTRFVLTGETAPRLHVDVTSMAGFLVPRLGFDPRSGISTTDWLSLSGQSVLEITAGQVFADTADELQRVRASLSWYPEDLWRYVLACDWARLAQELPLMSRAADVGDDMGSQLIAARSAHVILHLAFTLERRWAPYAKWFGTVFRTLRCAPALGPCIDRLLAGRNRAERERHVAAALQLLVEIQNDRGLTDVARATVPFWDRASVHPDPAIAFQLMAPVSDPTVLASPLGAGTVEQRTDNVDVLVAPDLRRAAVRR